jgi:hypothetical protein
MVEWLTDYKTKGMLSKEDAEHVARTDAMKDVLDGERLHGQHRESGVLDVVLYASESKYRGISYQLSIIKRYKYKYEPPTNTIALDSRTEDRWVFLEPTEKTKPLHDLVDTLLFIDIPLLWEDSGHSYTANMTLRGKWDWIENEAHRQIDAFWKYFTDVERFLKQANDLLREAVEHILHCSRCMTGELEAKPLWLWVCSNPDCPFESKMTNQ